MKARVLIPANTVADFNQPDNSVNPTNNKWVFVPQVDEDKPVYDAATKKVLPVVVVDTSDGRPTRVRRTWSIVSLSADELEASEIVANKDQIKALVAALKAGNASAANVQKALAWCIIAIGRMVS